MRSEPDLRRSPDPPDIHEVLRALVRALARSAALQEHQRVSEVRRVDQHG